MDCGDEYVAVQFLASIAVGGGKMRYKPVPKELLEKTRRMIDTLILINSIKKKRCGCDLCRYLKKVVAWVEG